MVESVTLRGVIAMKYKWLFFLILLLPVSVYAAPSITTHSGTLANGNTITVTGTGFGVVPTNLFHGDLFDDYTKGSSNACMNANPSYLFCRDNASESPNQPPSTGSKWSWDGGLTSYFTNGDAGNSTSIDPEPLLGIKSGFGMYSTGYGYSQAIEEYSSDGSHPNSGFYISTGGAKSVYFVAYIKYDPEWDSDYTPCLQDKTIEFWSGSSPSGCKNTVMLTNGSAYWGSISRTSWGMSTECGGNLLSGHVNDSTSWFTNPGHWQEHKIRYDISAGVFKYWLNGNLIQNNNSASFGQSGLGCVQLFSNVATSNHAFSMSGSDSEWPRYMDDVLIWNSYQSALDSQFPVVPAVYLSNSRTFTLTDHDQILNGTSAFVRQRVGGSATADLGFKSWTNSQIKFEVNLGSLNTGQTIYVYSYDWSGNISAGYPLNTGPVTGNPPPAPLYLSIVGTN